MAVTAALAPVRVTAPASLPVSLAELKTHLRVDSDESDAELGLLLEMAVGSLDGWSGELGRCLITQTWRMDLPCFPNGDTIRLPFPNVSATVVVYTDDSDTEQPLASGKYSLHESAGGTLLVLDDEEVWPSTDIRPDAVRITMTVGYGAAAANVPAEIRWAILAIAAEFWRNREAMAHAGDLVRGYTARLLAGHRRVPI